MELDVIRWSSGFDSTLGGLFIREPDRHFLCFTLEDEYRAAKVFGETRIPAGRYRILLRIEGSKHVDYLEKYGPDFHKGMLWLQDVPNFEWILIHSGNHDGHTAGCLLVGNTQNENVTDDGFVGNSVNAYKRIYPPIRDALLAGEEVWITYTNLDSPAVGVN
jgi:hypothetical protein